MSMKSLQDARAKAQSDEFEIGTVIRWVSSGRFNYAALKAGNGLWYSTAQDFNTHVPQVMSFEKLLEVLGKSEVSQVLVSTDWEEVD